MSLETAQYVHQLNPANPSGADRLKEGDDHIRMLKAVLKATFPGITGPLDADVTHTLLNALPSLFVKPGEVRMFYGAPDQVAAGWAICDGRTVPKSDGTGNTTTPDFRDRVPVGVSPTRALGDTFGQTERIVTSAVAGGHSHTATTAASGEHNHTLSGGTIGSATTGITPNITRKTVDAGGSEGGMVRDLTLTDTGHTHTLSGLASADSGSHTHTLTTTTADAHAHSVTVDVTQPSIALYFIIKV